MGEMGDMFFPDCCERLIRGPDLILADDLPHLLPFAVMDQHAVTTEFPADGRTGGIDCTDKTVTGGVFPEERTFFFRGSRTLFLIQKRSGNILCILRLDMDKEKIICDAIPAIIVPFRQLALYPDKFPKTPAAFPAPVTNKFRHR
jgi:hypothetical protein